MEEPAYAFSIPSIDNDTPLDCRLYHPRNFQQLLNGIGGSGRSVKGAIVAHPYAPLGGCYDDLVVLSVTETLLGQGFVVGTFNFRGALGSQGSTTWSGKGEQADYVSFTGFITYYLQALSLGEESYQLQSMPPRSGIESHGGSHAKSLELLLAGYSYGSLILARTPAISEIIERFETAALGTAAAEIIMRARTLAKQSKHALDQTQSPSTPRGRQLKPDDANTSPTSRIGVSPITVGGEETDPSTRRQSRDSKRSLDIVRKSFEAPRRIRAHMRRPSTSTDTKKKENEKQTPILATAASKGPLVRTRYLLISPVLMPFTNALCPPSFVPGLKRIVNTGPQTVSAFNDNSTLAVFGSSDGFTSSRRLKAWAEKTAKESKADFEWACIDGAGHFWKEEGVMQASQERIAAWSKPN